MKYIIELEKIEGTDLMKAVGANTLVFDKWGVEHLLTPYEEPKREIDWSKVPKDTPVFVWDTNSNEAKRRYFSYFNPKRNDPYVCFDGGGTSWSIESRRQGAWAHCELAFPEQAKEEWYK